MRLIKNSNLVDTDWVFTNQADYSPRGEKQILPFKIFAENPSLYYSSQTPLGVQIKADCDLEEISRYFSKISLIVIEFTSFADGRGFSIARRLRDSFGYRGEIWAGGHLFADQYPLAVQCGIDAVVIDESLLQRQPLAHWQEAISAHPAFMSAELAS